MGLREDLEAMQAKAEQALADVSDESALDAWRTAYLGKKGELTEILRSLGSLAPEERPVIGRLANLVKEVLQEAYERREEAIRQQALQEALQREALDVRLPGRRPSVGHIHISRQTLREIYDIFAGMGFTVLRSPEVETDVRNFQLLNIPPHHPARDMWSTFYTTKPGVLLRTHTSPGQIHAMRRFAPEPVRVILPGKCYRYEQVTTRSEHMFYQVEGLVIGNNITMADLKGVLTRFAREMFGSERQLRFRPSYFPFTEPSAEADIDCMLCGGEGCQVCKYTGWLEILGAGMVHPTVLRNGGYDPEEFSGFAFGMGPERIAMLRHGIRDIRQFFGNDVRFLHQFG